MDQHETVEFAADDNKKAKLPRRFYTVPQVLFGVFLGGPLAGFFLMRRNYATMGDEDRASSLGFWGILSMFPFLMAIFLLPEEVPGAVVQGVMLVGFTGYIHNAQRERIQAMETGGVMQRFTHWRMVGVALLSALITMAMGVVLLMAIEAAAPDLFAKMFPEETAAAVENTQAQ